MSKLFQIDESQSFEELLKHRDILEAADMIRAGGLVAFPTETVYGLGANAFDPEAGKKIYAAKGRPSDNPLIVHVSNLQMLEQVVRRVSPEAKSLIERFFPAPLTLIMKKSSRIPQEITAGLDTVAIRMPDHPIALALIEAAGVPVAAPSANLSGKPSPTHYQYVIEDLNGRVDAIICSQDSKIGIESTILDISEEKWKILRPGAIGPGELKAFCPELIYEANSSEKLEESEIPKAPGMKYRHYSPNAKVQILSYDKKETDFDLMVKSYQSQGLKVYVIQEKDSKKLAKIIFKEFRRADELGYDIILVKEVRGDDMSEAVMNRIRKAAN